MRRRWRGCRRSRSPTAAPLDAPTAARLRAAVPGRPLDQRLPGGRRQQRPAARRRRRDHRRAGRRHRRGRETTCTCSSTSGCPTTTACKVAEALKRAAARGVACRAMADALGSRLMIRAPRMAGDARRRRPARRALPIGNPLLRAAQGPHRPAQPPQDRGDRQPHHLLRQPELRRPRVPHQGEVRALGRRHDALRGADRPPGAAPLRRRLDGAHQRGPRRPAAPTARRRAAPGFAGAGRSAPGRRCATPPCRRCSRR